MKLSQLTAKPQLIEFWTWDRQPMDTFMKLANSNGNDISNIISVVRTLILDEKGKQILKDEEMLPTHVLMKAIGKVTELLGK